MKIPFNKPFLVGKEFEYMKQAIENQKISGDGYFSEKIHKFIEQTFNTKKALFVTSGTAALEMSSLLLDLRENDEVILPSYTFVSTANAVVLRNAKVVFCDIDPKTLNIDVDQIEQKITDKTKAIYPVHYSGISCDMDKLIKIANKYNLKVVEDAAQAVRSMYKQRYLGTIGTFGCYSFHETKNYSCGEGGLLLVNSPEYISRAEIIREKGTNRNKFFRGEINKYTWVDIGSSYVASDLLGAFLWAQLEQLDTIYQIRKRIFDYYYTSLKPLSDEGFFQLPFIPEYCSPNYHMFYLILPDSEKRNQLLSYLNEQGVNAVFHYIPLHLSPMGAKMGYKEGDFPITESISSRLIRLPFYNNMNDEELNYVVDSIYRFIKLNK